MREVLIKVGVVGSDESVFLCGFFWGMANGLPSSRNEGRGLTSSQKIAATNFRRVYSALTTDEKKEVRSQIAEFESCSADVIDGIIQVLTDERDKL
jgi:hypothetical protein